MENRQTCVRRMGAPSRCARAGLALSLWAFFFTADVKLMPDGSGTIVATYPQAPIHTRDSEEGRFASSASHATNVDLRDKVARVEVEFTDVTHINEAPELAGMKFSLDRKSAAEWRLHAIVRSPSAGNVTSPEDATIKISTPGPILSANTQHRAGATATWKAPVKQYFTTEGIEIDVTYKASGVAKPAE